MIFSRNLFVTLLTLQFMLDISIFLNVPIARQVLGFLYLTIVPGVIILSFIKLKELNLSEMILLSTGLSIAFLMFFGLMLNELLPLVGVLNPLSEEILIVGLNILVTSSCLILFFKEKSVENTTFEVSFMDLAMLSVFIFLLILSVFGTIYMNIYGNNLFLLLMFVLVPLFALITIIFRKKFTFDIIPLCLMIIYVAILLATWLTTNHLLGYDIHPEFYTFQLTQRMSIWNPAKSFNIDIDKGNAMLSISVLPTIFSKIMNLDPTWVFKIVYPLMASFVPLGLYQFHLLHAKKEAAFFGVFLLITYSLDGLGSLKEWIATIFYVLLFFIIFSKNIPTSKKKILFIIFAGALVVSHYAKSYIFLFIIFFLWAVMFVFKKDNPKLTLGMVLIFFSFCFAWYIFTVQAVTFEALVSTIDNIYRNLSREFFEPESRGSEVMTALGLLGPPTYLHLINRILFYLTQLLLVIGFISTALKFRKAKVDLEYFIVICINMSLLAMTIILPRLAPSFTMGRFYRTALVILGPLCVFGSEEIVNSLYRIKSALPQKRKLSGLALTSMILVPHFLFQTGFFYEVAEVECWSIPLSRYRMPPAEVSGPLLYSGEVSGAIWLFQYADRTSALYADHVAIDRVLTSYGLVEYGRFRILDNTTAAIEVGGLTYLRRLNTVHEIMVGGYVPQWNITDLQTLLESQNMIYSSGECLIYKNPK